MSASPIQRSISGQSASLLSSERRLSVSGQSDDGYVYDPALKALSHDQLTQAIEERRGGVEEVEEWFMAKTKDPKHLESMRQGKCNIKSMPMTHGGFLVDIRLKARPLLGGHHIVVDGEADDSIVSKLRTYESDYADFDKYYREVERRKLEHTHTAPAKHESIEMQVKSLQGQVRGLEGQVKAMKELLAEIYYCPGMPWHQNGASAAHANAAGVENIAAPSIVGANGHGRSGSGSGSAGASYNAAAPAAAATGSSPSAAKGTLTSSIDSLGLTDANR